MNMHVKPNGLAVGDRVRVTHTDFPSLIPVGVVAKVARILRHGDADLVYNDSPELFFYRSEFELAPKFAVGDKVRLTRDNDGFGVAGDTGTVVKENGGSDDCRVKFDRIIRNHNEWWVKMPGLELIPTHTSCAAAEVDNLRDEYGGGVKFKVGDRVNWTRVRGEFDGSIIEEIVGGVWPVTIRAPNGQKTYAALSELEHVAVAPATATTPPATLRIESGKFYKTRDGRKVGPTQSDCQFAVSRDHQGRKAVAYIAGMGTYAANGDWLTGLGNHRNDLIAEWQDEPVVAGVTGDKFREGITLGDILAAALNPTSKPAIVCLIENGQPKPSTLPFVHASRQAATTEANRLAGKYKGQEFGVYELVSTAKVEKPAVVYDFEWQSLAKNGSFFSAVTSLRRLSGLGSVEAQSAVEDWLTRN